MDDLDTPSWPRKPGRSRFTTTEQVYAALEVGHPHPTLAVHAQALPHVAPDADPPDDLEGRVTRGPPEYGKRTNGPQRTDGILSNRHDRITTRVW
jgi:hypothetical protein